MEMMSVKSTAGANASKASRASYSFLWRIAFAIRTVVPLNQRGVVGKWLIPIVHHLIWRLSGPHKDMPVLVHGHLLYLAETTPPLTDMVVGRYAEARHRWLVASLEDGMNFVDLGAHVGYFTLVAARSVGPSGKVWAFEPSPENYRILLKNIEKNGYKNVTAVPKAVSNHSGPVQLFPVGLTSAGYTIRHGSPAASTLQVEATTLDEYFANEGWPRIDVVKMDIEGAEMMALEGARCFLERNRPLRLIFECWPAGIVANGQSLAAFLEELQAFGFRVLWDPQRTGSLAQLRHADSSEMYAAAGAGKIDLLLELPAKANSPSLS